jgi:paraquat-inducible protein A
MTSRNRLAIVLAVVSLALLGPGLFKPMLTIRASFDLFGSVKELANETRSIVGAIKSLHESGNDFVAGLILLFSILVPLVKAALLVPILASKDPARRRRVFLFVRSISKWSMADVFAIGIFIAFLAAKATKNMNAVAGPGFYYFAAYCIVSNAAFQVLRVDDEKPAPVERRSAPLSGD